MKSAQNTMGIMGTPEWHPKLVGSSDSSVGEGPGRWERLPPTETKSHNGKAMSYE